MAHYVQEIYTHYFFISFDDSDNHSYRNYYLPFEGVSLVMQSLPISPAQHVWRRWVAVFLQEV